MSTTRHYTLGEEIANAVTHGAGLLAAALGAPFLVLAAQARGDDALRIAGVVVFAVTLVLLYAASTLYHAVPVASEWKRILRLIDHSAIYLLIAGTYTPFAIGVLRGVMGWSLFGVIWTAAVVGIVFKTTLGFRFPRASTITYVAMGWVGALTIKPMVEALPFAGVAWLIGGGLAYTGGVVFYAARRPRYMHAVWHLFVLTGSACHWCAVYWYA